LGWLIKRIGGRRSFQGANDSASLSPGRSSTIPSLILADEPTGSLDSKAEKAVLDLLRELHRERGGDPDRGDARCAGRSSTPIA
jgi:hypothetical protein